MLEALTRSLRGFVDELVILEGRWDGMPKLEHNVGDEVFALVRGAGTPPGIHWRGRRAPWPSQAAKRDALMRWAAGLADWILVVDGDERVSSLADPHVFRDQLAAADELGVDVCTVDHGDGRPLRRLFRSSPTLTVGPSHADYRHGNRWLAGATVPTDVMLEPTAHVAVTILHDRHERTLERNRAARAYRNAEPNR